MFGIAAKSAIDAFHEIECDNSRRGKIPPVARLGVVVAFLLVLVSFGKYDLAPLLALTLYPATLICFERVPIFSAVVRFWFLLIPVFIMGAVNPFFDRQDIVTIGGVAVSGGCVSFAVLILKGIFSLAVSWSLLRKIGVSGLVNAFATLRLPSSFGLSVLLMHRYLVLMIKEMNRMRDAYVLRSGTLKRAIHPASWGSFAGLLLMRSMDRASCVQSAIELRGSGDGILRLSADIPLDRRSFVAGILYFAGWVSFFMAARFFEPMRCLGDIIREVLG
jgi:cobalt/nickel transport system permease protein